MNSLESRSAVALCLAASLLLGACSDPAATDRGAAAAASAPTAAYVASAKGRIDIEGGLIRLAAQREGVIDKVLVEEGDTVQRNQVLAVLVDEQARRATALARAEQAQSQAALPAIEVRLAAALREEQRLAPLAADQTVAAQDLDNARDQVRAARAEQVAARAAVASAAERVKQADYEIEQRVVRAPLAGKIVKRQARPGDGVSIATVTPLFLFAPDGPRIVRAELEERFVPLVRAGQVAQVTLEADESRQYSARVLRLGHVVGQPSPSDDPTSKRDSSVVECVLSIEAGDVLIGQRVIVRFSKGQ
jgi:HlyD family secretion protein